MTLILLTRLFITKMLSDELMYTVQTKLLKKRHQTHFKQLNIDLIEIYLFIIRPIGVVSKKAIGECNTLCNMERCNLLEARTILVKAR